MVRRLNPPAQWFGATVLLLAMLIGARASADDTGNGMAEPDSVDSVDSVAPPLSPSDDNAVDPRFPPPGLGREPSATDDVRASEPAYDVNADTDPAALTDFREALDPYGTWEEDPTYGVVWVPSPSAAGTDFAPYVTAGHWGASDSGDWIWVSDYSWGWAPFHYGRWAWRAQRGWGWVPGRVYAPAWVAWRTGYYDDYYVGWAPMPPSWYWYGGVAVGLRFRPSLPFVFCSSRYVFAPHVYGHLVSPGRVGLVAGRTQPYYGPTVSVGAHHALSMTRGPSFATAHVPASGMPAQRTLPDARAISYAHSTARVYRGNEGLGLGRSTTLGNGYTSRPASPSLASPRAYPPSYRSAPSYVPRQGAPSTPAYGSRSSGSFTYTAPRSIAPSSPVHSNAPSHGAPSYHAAPSFHSSAPSYHAAPSFHGGGASFHGGGGRHR